MKFDVVIGNPPYQKLDKSNSGSATPLYNLFIERAIELNPNYISMITPSRWMFGGKGLNTFRYDMLKNNNFTRIINYENPKDCFPSVNIPGEISYFLINNKCKNKSDINNLYVKNIYSNGDTDSSKRQLNEHIDKNLFIVDNVINSIISKVIQIDNLDNSFADLVSPRNPYGIHNLKDNYYDVCNENSLRVYNHKIKAFIDKDVVKRNKSSIYKDKIFISHAYGGRPFRPKQIINKPFIPDKNSVCGGTYLLIGPFTSRTKTENVLSYMKTKFFSALILSIKRTHHGARGVYQFVPLQDWSKPWTDEELYNKYNLSQREIDYIEKTIKAMD